MTAIEAMTRARMRLLLDPTWAFYAIIAMRLDMVSDKSVATACTDGNRIRFNPAFIDTLSPDECYGLLIHELDHVAKGHTLGSRRGKRPSKQCNIACDATVNETIRDAGGVLPADGIYPETIEAPPGLSAEGYYRFVDSDDPDDPDTSPADDPGDDDDGGDVDSADDGDSDSDSDSGSGDSDSADAEDSDSGGDADTGGSDPDDGSDVDTCPDDSPTGWGDVEDTPVDDEPDVKQSVADAYEACIGRSDAFIPASIRDALEADRTPPIVDWREVLREYLTEAVERDWTYARMNRCVFHTIGVVGPDYGPAEPMAGTVAVMIDVSSSMNPRDIADALACVRECVESGLFARLAVIYFNTGVVRSFQWEPMDGECPDLTDCRVGGGTSHIPAFAWIADNCDQVDAIVSFSDMQSIYPDTCPEAPVIWGLVNCLVGTPYTTIPDWPNCKTVIVPTDETL